MIYSCFVSLRCAGNIKKLLASVLAFQVATQPLQLQAADLIADQAAANQYQPDIGTAQNGVPLVDIVAPNAKGLSHNKYEAYNVGTSGLILNNLDSQVGVSQLGGALRGNDNLRSSGSASVILNEVTSTRQSLLEGTTEVFGSSADVVIANPNGLTCDGCGFINTPRVTLSSGVPVVGADGALSKLRIEGGAVNFGARGADLGSVDVFDILSQKISIGGPVKAKGALSAIAGNNNFDYQTREVTRLPGAGTGPEVAIDSSALGGMYAGSISLISTSEGSGVRMHGDMAAHTGQMHLTADGKIVFGKARAKARLSAISQNDSIEAADLLYSEGTITLHAAKTIAVADDAIVGALGEVNVTASAVSVGKNATLRSGLTEDGTSGDKAADLVLTIKDTAALGSGVLTSTGDTRISAGKIDLTAPDGRAEDTLSAQGKAVFNADEIIATGSTISAQQGFEIANTGALLMSGGIYHSGQLIDVTADEITLDATLHATGKIQVTANTGALTSSGTIQSDRTVNLAATSALHHSGTLKAIESVTFSSSGKMTNAAGAEVSGSSLELTSHILENDGDLIARSGSVTASVAQDLTNAGTITSKDALILGVDGTVSNTGALKSEAAITVRGRNADGAVAAFAIETSGEVKAHSLSARANTLSNKGLLSATDGGLTLWSTEELLNEGTLETNLALVLNSETGFRNSGTLSAGEMIRFEGGTTGTLTNTASGLVTGTAGVLFNGLSFDNQGRFGTSAGDLALNAAGDMQNSGLLYASQNATLKFDGTFTNSNGDLISEDTVTLGGLTSDKAASVLNENGGVIKAVIGDLSIKANSIINRSADPVIQIKTEVTDLDPEYRKGPGERHHINTYTQITVNTEELVEDQNPSRLLAGQDLLLEGQSVENSFAQIAADGNIQITAVSLENKARALIEEIVTKKTEKHKQSDCGLFGCDVDRWENVTEEKTTTTVDTVKSTISAGKTLTIDVAGHFDNGGMSENATQIGLSSGNDAFTTPNNPEKLDLNLGSLKELGFQQTVAALQNKEHLFITNKDPDAPYLIETRNDFIDVGRYVSSDYFLEKSGITQEELDVKRLGDGFVETRLIRDQIFELTGQLYLHDVANEAEQMQRLYDNAADMSSNLQLSFGVSLSPDQQAALTKDIVWLEKRMVAGQEVLVPVVYLAQGRTLTAGAKLTGETVAIAANTVENSGAIIADTTLSMDVADTLTNKGGQLSAGGDLTLGVENKLTNLSGQIDAKNIDITAGEVENRTAVTRDETEQGYADRAQAIASVSATENLTIKSNGDLTSAGARLSAGKTLDVEAAGDVTLSSVETETKRGTSFGGNHDRSASLTNRFSEVSAGENLNIRSGQDLTIQGANISSSGDASLEATGDVKIAAVTDTKEHDFKLEQNSGFLGGSSKTKTYTYEETVQGSNLDVADNLTITSGADTTITASTLSAGENMTITTGGALNVEGQAAGAVSDSYTKSTGFLSKKSHTRNISAEGYASSSLLAGGDLTLTADQDLTVTASSIVGGGDVVLAGKNVSLETSETQSSVFDQKKKSGFFAGGVDGGIGISVGYRSQKDKVQQSGNTRIVSNVNAGKNLTITADNDLTSQAALLTAEEDVTLQAGNDIKLTPAHDSQSRKESHKVDEIALTVALRENVSANLETLIEVPQEATKGKGSGFNKAVTAASSALKAAEAAQALANGPLVSLEVGIGASSKKSSSSSSAETARVGQVTAGQDLIIEAGRDIISEGTQMNAGRDATLDAGRDITLTAAENTTDNSSKSSERSVGVKASVGIGMNGPSVGVSGSVAGQNGKSNGSTNTKTNALVKAGRDVSLDAERDLTLKGARVEGETITADVGRDLSIESVQDTSSSKNKSRGGSVGVSISPNSVGVNGSIDFADGSASKAWVDEQSGLFGEKAVTVTVGENTDLKGGVINSESGELTLDTGTLTFSDVQDHNKSQQTSGSLSASLSFSNSNEERNGVQDELADLQDDAQSLVERVDPPTQEELNDHTGDVASGQVTPGGSVEGSYGSTDKRQVTRATVGEGTIIIRDEEKQQELEDSGETENVANLNRDIDVAQEVTKDEEEYVGVYVSDTAIEAVQTAVRKATEPGGFIDRYLLGKELTEDEKQKAKQGVDALVAGGQLGGCTTTQSFSIFDLFISSAYAADVTQCFIVQADGSRLELGIKTYEECQDAIYAYLNQLPTSEKIELLNATGFAGGVGSRSGEAVEDFMVMWLLDAAEQIDGEPRGELFNAYSQGLADGTDLREHMTAERWQIWADPNQSVEQKIAALEDTGLEFGTVIAMAMLGGVRVKSNATSRPFTTKIDDRIESTEHVALPGGIAKTFRNSEYATVKTITDTPVYRKFGGGSDQAKVNGGFAGTEKNLGRNETAVFPKWNSTQFEAEIVIPKGTQIHVGRVAPQPIGSTAPRYRGGADQVLLPRDYPDAWIKSVRDGKTGKVYSLSEFKAKFPDQFN